MSKKQNIEEPEEEEVKSNLTRNILIGLAVAVLIFFICAVAIKHPLTVTEVRSVEEAYTTTEVVEEAYQTTEYVNEVYTATECVNKVLSAKTENYAYDGTCVAQDTKCDSYEQYCCANNWYGGCTKYCSRCAGYSYPCTSFRHTCSINIRNLDNEQGGIFVFSNAFKDFNGKTLKEEKQSVYVARADSERINFYYFTGDEEGLTCGGAIIGDELPTKSVCSQVARTRSVPKTVTKTRLVNRDVVKTRMVDRPFQVVKYYTWMEQWSGNVRYYYKV